MVENFKLFIARTISLSMLFQLSGIGPTDNIAFACQGCALTNAGNVFNPASTLSDLLGKTSIADGAKNQQQGQADQNMAQMAMGAMQIAQGLLGLLAAAAAAKKGNTSDNRASNLSDLNNPYQSTVGNSSTGASSSGGNTTGTSNTGAVAGSTSTIGITPDDLRAGVLGKAMDGIEKNYGISRDNFFDALKAGVDPKDLLAKAPKNAPSMEMLNKISEGLAANNTAGNEAASHAIGAINPAGGLPPSELAAPAMAKGPRVPASTAPTGDDIETDPNAGMGLSPEVRAAMADRANKIRAEKEMIDMHGWNIFQLVHNRYQKLETMLYGRVERTNISPTSNQKGF